jgi:GTP cyclohydrolase II
LGFVEYLGIEKIEILSKSPKKILKNVAFYINSYAI